MKSISSYEGDEAIELFADILEPVSKIMTNPATVAGIKESKNAMGIASAVLINNKPEVKQVLLRIDPTPINGLNLIVRTIGVLKEIMNNDELKDFFKFAEPEKTE